MLKGAKKSLDQVRALEVKVEFSPLYEGQPLFADIDMFLRERGFVLSKFTNLVQLQPTQKDLDRIEKWEKEVGETPKVIFVETVPINKILEEHKLFHIDFLSLDIEGGELNILKAIDFERFFIDVISVENNWEDPICKEAKNSTIRKYMEESGYDYITRLGVDEVYRKKNL